jgi:hypothetical protein
MTRVPAPVLVTTAPKSPRDEQRERQRRYLATMGLRVVCFVAAIVLFSLDLRWEAGIAVGASLILPWVAVIAANGGPKTSTERPALYAGDSPRELEGNG